MLSDFANHTERRSKSFHFKINYNWELDPCFLGGKKDLANWSRHSAAVQFLKAHRAILALNIDA